VQHVYQRGIKGHLIFYSIKDYLVFYTIISVVARRYGVQLLGICLMVDHFHILCICDSKEAFSSFMRDATRWYALLFNKNYGTKGSVFSPRFGSSSKIGEKKIRTAIAYLYNNPIERKLCTKVDAYRWNFLKYAEKKYPFSEMTDKDRLTRDYRRAMQLVKAQRHAEMPLNYSLLQKIMDPLSAFEKQRLTDMIVKEYECVDYLRVSSFYKSFRKMLEALDANTGSEYDIHEDFEPGSDRIYYRLIDTVGKMEAYRDIMSLLSAPYEERRRVGLRLQRLTQCSARQLEKLLRL